MTIHKGPEKHNKSCLSARLYYVKKHSVDFDKMAFLTLMGPSLMLYDVKFKK